MSGEMFQSIFYCTACFCFIFVALTYTKILALFKTENNFLKLPIGISLDEEDFCCLVRGGVLNVCYMRNGKSHLVRMILKDIGFHRMQVAIDAAEEKKDLHKDHNKLVD